MSTDGCRSTVGSIVETLAHHLKNPLDFWVDAIRVVFQHYLRKFLHVWLYPMAHRAAIFWIIGAIVTLNNIKKIEMKLGILIED